MDKESADKIGHAICEVLNKQKGCYGSMLITLMDEKGYACSSVTMMVDAAVRGVIPSLLRDLALTCEKQNLMAGIKTEELNPEHTTEILHEGTRKVRREQE